MNITLQNIKKKISNLPADLRDQIVSLAIFGSSFYWNKVSSQSDIDFLVMMKEIKSENLRRLKNFLARSFCLPVNKIGLVYFAEKDFEFGGLSRIWIADYCEKNKEFETILGKDLRPYFLRYFKKEQKNWPQKIIKDMFSKRSYFYNFLLSEKKGVPSVGKKNVTFKRKYFCSKIILAVVWNFYCLNTGRYCIGFYEALEKKEKIKKILGERNYNIFAKAHQIKSGGNARLDFFETEEIINDLIEKAKALVKKI